MLRIVLDTNVLIDASSDYFHYANRILDLVIAGQIEAFANSQTISENRLMANRKISDAGYQKKLEYFFDKIKPVENIHGLNAVEDYQDNKILASAIKAKADFLISSDQHLLKLEKYKGIRIVCPDSFWQIWEEEGESGWQKWLKSFIR